MLTQLSVRNFKRFRDLEIELGSPVVFIGPNNSGKTTALQALSLWHVGVRRWQEKRAGKEAPEKRPGVTINRRDLVSVPIPGAKLLWRNLHVRDVRRIDGDQRTENICVEVTVEGINADRHWRCGLEFDYANEESFYCRPLRLPGVPGERMPVPPEAAQVKVAFLPPMSGLSAQEPRLDAGFISVRIGEGRTAEVLRNLCDQVEAERWEKLTSHIDRLFGVNLAAPEYIAERGELVMTYREPGVRDLLDISAAGRGLHQTLLVLAYLSANPGAALLLDEPDAHLEILRQREIYQLLADTAAEQGSQVIAASHSEVLLNEAADRHLVVAFVGRPHRLSDRGSNAHKALRSIGFDQYYQAETTGWVLYLEGSTDLAILRALAETLAHPAAELLKRPFVHYVENLPQKACEHFYGLREAKPDLAGIVIFDRLDTPPRSSPGLEMLTWSRNEIENYVFFPEVLLEYARKQGAPLFTEPTMQQCIEDLVPRLALRNRDDPWWGTEKASQFLDRLFDEYFKRLNLPNLLCKSSYHELARLVPEALILPEIGEKLDRIVATARTAKPSEEQ